MTTPTDQKPPPMFEGVKSPPKSVAPDSRKSNDKTTGVKQPGVPTSHAFGWLVIPVLVLLGIWLYSVSHVAALVVGIALAVLLVLGLAARWFTRRVTQDVADKVSEKKTKERGRGREPRQPRQWSPRDWTPRGGGSSGGRNGGRPGGGSSGRSGGGGGRPSKGARGDGAPNRGPGKGPGRTTGGDTAGRSRNPFKRNRNNGGNDTKPAGGKPSAGGRNRGNSGGAPSGAGGSGGGRKKYPRDFVTKDRPAGQSRRTDNGPKSDKPRDRKPPKGAKSKEPGSKDPQKQSRWQWWTERNEPAQPPAVKGSRQPADVDDQRGRTSDAPASKPRRRWIPKIRRGPKPSGINPYVERLDRTWEARGLGRRSDAGPDVTRPSQRATKTGTPAPSHAVSGLLAEGDWKPAPADSTHDHASAEAGLMAEDWAPKPQPPQQPAQVAATARTEGAGQMSNNGQDASTATNRAAAYHNAANAAALVAQKKQNLANAKRQQAAALANREGTEGAAASLAASANKLQQDAATMGGFAGAFRQLAATTASIFRR